MSFKEIYHAFVDYITHGRSKTADTSVNNESKKEDLENKVSDNPHQGGSRVEDMLVSVNRCFPGLESSSREEFMEKFKATYADQIAEAIRVYDAEHPQSGLSRDEKENSAISGVFMREYLKRNPIRLSGPRLSDLAPDAIRIYDGEPFV